MRGTGQHQLGMRETGPGRGREDHRKDNGRRLEGPAGMTPSTRGRMATIHGDPVFKIKDRSSRSAGGREPAHGGSLCRF
jgi:hypothetical protein